MHRACAGATFATHNHPMNAVKPAREIERSKQWLNRQTTNVRRHIQQHRNALGSHGLILNAGHRPNVLRPRLDPWRKAQHVLGALREQQPIECRRFANQRPQPFALAGNGRMIFKHIRHRRTKHAPSFTISSSLCVPLDRLRPMRIAECFARSILPPQIVAISLGPRLCIAVRAAR